jgi:hypothetical protein
MINEIKKLDEDELVSIVSGYVNQSTVFQDNVLSKQMAEGNRYYTGQPLGNEKSDTSKVVSRDVADAIDWIMPSLMEIFGNGDKVVEYEPRNADDAEEAKQATDYINYIYNSRNNGFLITYQWFKDALLNKNGIVKHYWEETEEVNFDFYTGLDEESLSLLVAEDNIDIIEQTVTVDNLYDVKISKREKSGEVKVMNLPPEEFLINTEARSIEEADFTAHRRLVTKSDLRALGFDESMISDIGFTDENWGIQDEVYRSRHEHDATDQLINSSASNEAMRRGWLYECYVKVDYDGDGLAELRRIMYIDNKIISNEDWDLVPFSALTPNIISHKFYGLSLYDTLRDIQEIKSTLLRNLLDNMYRINNGRYAVLDGQVNMRDLLHNRAGGVVREKVTGAVRALEVPKLPVESFQMLSYLDTVAENRSGASSRTKGQEANTLHSNQAASSVNQVMTAAAQKQKLIARVFAETGFKQLFTNLYSLVTKHQDKEDIFRLRDKYVTVNPATWRDNANVTVSVGIGNDNKSEQQMHLQRMWEMTQGIINTGGMGILTNYDKMYNMMVEMSKNSGYKNYNDFWVDPSTPESQQAQQALQQAQSKPKPDEIKANADAQKKQADSQMDGQKLQAEAQTSDRELTIREREVAVKERELTIADEELQIQRERLQLDTFGKVADARLEREQGRSVAIGNGGGSSNATR